MCYFCFISFLLVCPLLGATPEQFLKRAHANLIIKDFVAASQEAKLGLEFYPNERCLNEMHIKTLAQAGDEKGLWDAWNQYVHLFPKVALTDQELHEVMAWGVIWKASESPLPLIRLCALLGAFFSNDAKSTPVLVRFCHDKNSLIRKAAVQLISNMRDAPLCDQILQLLSKEKNYKVRLEIIRAIGKMKIRRGHTALLATIANDQVSAEEKAAAIEAILILLEKVERQEIVSLVSSNRAGLRLLACQVVCHLHCQRDQDQMIRLASDNNSQVRAAALYALGVLVPDQNGLTSTQQAEFPLVELACSKLQDPSPEVAIIAAWLLTRIAPQSCREAFMPLVKHSNRDIRLKAAAAIAASGKYGVKLALELFHESQDDIFFKMNLAVGLIYQQTETIAACQTLHHGFTAEAGRWMWKEDGPFRILAPSTVKQEDEMPNAPESINQLTRLEILNMLAVMKYPGAEAAIRGFLQQHKWGITGLASVLLLMEGDGTSLDLVQGLLNDLDARIRLQAALTLSLWGGEKEAIAVLESGYASADRDTKEKILEGLGRIGSHTSIPFLLQRLQEPQQMLRLIAASSLLQCLYH